MKKAFTLLSILILTFGLFMSGYAVKCPSYASINDDVVWTPLAQQSDMVIAFQEYCKSRDLTIEGSLADAVTTFTTGAFNSLCNTLGFNMTQLQAEIKAEYDANGKPIKFLFTSTGIDAYNRIFAQFLQDNELEVGDTVDNKQLYDGYVYTTYDGKKCLVFVVNSRKTIYTDSEILQYGSPLGYTSEYIQSQYAGSTVGSSQKIKVDYSIAYTSEYTANIAVRSNGGYLYNQSNPLFYNTLEVGSDTFTGDGFASVCYVLSDSKFYPIGYSDMISGSINIHGSNVYPRKEMSFITNKINNDDQANVCNIYITTNNTTINNNNYEGDTIINNYPDDDPDDPDDPDPIYPDPEYPDPPTYDPDYPKDPITPQTPPDDWGIELPDFTDFDWIMSGLEKKFPWDIPFNIMFMLSLFVAEPEAPHFVGDIDLKVCNWHYDLDLEPFEPLADIFRKFFFIGFLLGLMLLTKQLIWG